MEPKSTPSPKEVVKNENQDGGILHLLSAPQLYELRSTERYVIREAYSEFFSDGQYTNAPDMATKMQDSFDELRIYHITVPAQFVVSENDKAEEVFFVIVEKVDARTFEELKGLEKERAVQGMALVVEGLVRYYEHKSESGKEFLEDLTDLDRYVYGTIEGNEHPAWYLIDTDPLYSGDKGSLLEVTDRMRDFLNDVEKRYSINVQNLRERCKKMADKLTVELGSERKTDTETMD